MFDFSELNKNIMEVVFTKKDGTVRKMICTKDMNKIPEENHPKGSLKNKNDDVVNVYDLQKNLWRSFRKNSVTSLKNI